MKHHCLQTTLYVTFDCSAAWIVQDRADTWGTLSMDTRLLRQAAEQDGPSNADRFTTPKFADSDNAATADLDHAECEQGWVSYAYVAHSGKVGRQVMALDGQEIYSAGLEHVVVPQTSSLLLWMSAFDNAMLGVREEIVEHPHFYSEREELIVFLEEHRRVG